MVPAGSPSATAATPEQRDILRSGLPPALPLTDISNLQNLYLTMGSLALQAGNLEGALRDYTHGVELTLCGPDLTANPQLSGDASSVTYTLKNMFQAINMHVQYIWLENSGDHARRLKTESALLEATNSEYNIDRFRKYTQQYVRIY